jgi:hypothetical protein
MYLFDFIYDYGVSGMAGRVEKAGLIEGLSLHKASGAF